MPAEPQTIVAEVTKTWTPDSKIKPLISEKFETVIAVNRERGYALKSWQFTTVVNPVLAHITETIVAVFEKTE